jgi:DNA helicase II / ATP-dependent DNA helicase PcrA
MSQPNAKGGKPEYLRAAEQLRRNKGQWQAYISSGNCVILAGPGSGKTKTLTIKLAKMLAEDVRPPRGIACITYNNQCARELKRRLSALGVEDGRRASIGTLHSFCLQHIVLPYARLAGIEIPDPLKVAVKKETDQCFATAVRKVKGYDEPWPDWLRRCSTHRRTHLDRDKPEWYGDNEDAARIIEIYERELLEKGLIDFDGMILKGLDTVEHHAWARKALQAKFPILVVDEYQDLGLVLHRIVLALCFEAGMRLVAVGDPDQSIYGFNDAEPQLLQNLSNMDDTEKVELKINYRCGPTIIQASEEALGERRDYESDSDERGTLDMYCRPEGIEDQAQFICDSIIPEALQRREGRQRGDIAVLYRDKNDGDIIAAAVEHQGWDFIRIDQGNPYPRSPVVFWLEDCAAWCVGGWRTGQPRLSELIRSWLKFNLSVGSDIERRQLQRNLVGFLYQNRRPDLSLSDWLSGFLSKCLQTALETESTLREDRDNVSALQKVCAAGARLARFTVSAFGGQAGTSTHLNLMTLHSAKGLEFDVVVMMGLEEGRLPSFGSTTEEKLREDRRLFYVGLTRARHEVHLVYSGWYCNQYGRPFSNGCSRFIQDVRKYCS